MFADELRAREDEQLSSPLDYDRFLVEQAKAGETEVWEYWFDQYYQKLYDYALIRTRRKSDAEDIVAQVLLEAVKGIGRYEYKGRPIIAWLFGIAHNLIADSIQQKIRRATNELMDPVGGGQSAELDSRIENIDLLQALDSLTDEQRDVIILRYFMEIRPREIGALLGKSEAAIYSLQARAILTLRASMGSSELT